MVRDSYNYCRTHHNYFYHHDHNYLDDYQHRARRTDLHLDRPRD
jgi:hypothetical protein